MNIFDWKEPPPRRGENPSMGGESDKNDYHSVLIWVDGQRFGSPITKLSAIYNHQQ